MQFRNTRRSKSRNSHLKQKRRFPNGKGLTRSCSDADTNLTTGDESTASSEETLQVAENRQWNTQAEEFKPRAFQNGSTETEISVDVKTSHRTSIQKVGEIRKPENPKILLVEDWQQKNNSGSKIVITRLPREPNATKLKDEASKVLNNAPMTNYHIIEFTEELPAGNLCQTGDPIKSVIPTNTVSLHQMTQYREALRLLSLYIDPAKRVSSPEINLQQLLAATLYIRHRIVYRPEEWESMEDAAKKAIAVKLIFFLKSFHSIQYASKGFLENGYSWNNFPHALLEAKWDDELNVLESFYEEFSQSALGTEELDKMYLEEKERSQHILTLIANDDCKELEKMDILYAATPRIRLIHNMPVTNMELFELVQESVSTDYGYFLWLIESKPELLLNRYDIVECVMSTFHTKLLSKDQRPIAALFTMMPLMLASLTEEDRAKLCDTFLENRIVKIKNWPEIFLQGYHMNWYKEQRKNGVRSICNEKCAITGVLLKTTSAAELSLFLLFCMLVAELGEGYFEQVYDHSTDAFLTRIARILTADIPVAKKELLLEALMSLPVPVKAKLLAEENNPPKTSFYYIAECIFNSTLEPQQATHALLVLFKHISPTKFLTKYLFPCLDDLKYRRRSCDILMKILKGENDLKNSISKEHSIINFIADFALKQYAEPEGGTKKQARYKYIETFLNFVDSALINNESLVADINNRLTERDLTWYQLKVIQDICFPKSKQKLVQPEVPIIENTIESMEATRVTAILQCWPEIGNECQKIFEKLLIECSTNLDKAKLTYVIMSAAVEESSKIKNYEEYLSDFLNNTFLNKDRCVIQIGEEENLRNNADTEWFQNLLNNTDVNTKVKDTVCAIAFSLPKYRHLELSRQKGRETHKRKAQESSRPSPNNDEKPVNTSKGRKRNRKNKGKPKDLMEISPGTTDSSDRRDHSRVQQVGRYRRRAGGYRGRGDGSNFRS